MEPPQALAVLIAACITGLIGWAVGRKAGQGNSGWWLGFLLSLLGVAIITFTVLTSPGAREEARVKREADRLRVRQAAQERIDAERRDRG
jgi:hypothetical protein